MRNTKVDNNYPELPSVGFIRLPHLLFLLGGLPPSTFWDAVRQGRFPRPVKLTNKTVAWPVGQVRELLQKIADGQ